MIRFLLRLFRRRTVVVNTYHTQKTDWIKRHFELHRQLAEELGREWPEKR